MAEEVEDVADVEEAEEVVAEVAAVVVKFFMKLLFLGQKANNLQLNATNINF